MDLAETNPSVCAPRTPLCAHTPHVKPSDACTAALTCQSQLGEGESASHKAGWLLLKTDSACEGVRMPARKTILIFERVKKCSRCSVWQRERQTCGKQPWADVCEAVRVDELDVPLKYEDREGVQGS